MMMKGSRHATHISEKVGTLPLKKVLVCVLPAFGGWSTQKVDIWKRKGAVDHPPGVAERRKKGEIWGKKKTTSKKHVEGGEEGKSMAHVVLFPRAMPTGLLEPWPGETKK